MSRPVGLDISSSAVRVAQVAGIDRDGNVVVKKAGIVPLMSGAVEGGLIRDAAAVGSAVRQALKQAGVARSTVVAGIATPATAVSTLNIPRALKPKEWAPALRTSGNDPAPNAPLDSSTVSIYPLGREEGAQRTLVIGAAPNKSVGLLRQIAGQSHISLRAIDLTASALLRALVRTEDEGDTTTSTVIDLGATTTTVVTRVGEHIRATRTIDHGGNNITKALVSSAGLSFARANDLKQHMGAVDTDMAGDLAALAYRYSPSVTTSTGRVEEAADIHDVFRKSVTALAEKATTAIRGYIDELPGRSAGHITLTGGSAHTHGLTEEIAALLGDDNVTMAAPPIVVENSRRTKHLRGSDTPGHDLAEQLVIAAGLSLWEDGR